MRITCWITKAKDTHSEQVILIAFPLQHRLHERASILRLYVTLPVLFALPYPSFSSSSSSTHVH
jgi:hypothetical protein